MFFKTWKQNLYNRAHRDGYNARWKEQMDTVERIRRVEEEEYLHAPLIVVPNEWDNPVIGFGEHIQMIGAAPVLVVRNYLTNQNVICGGVKMGYSEQRLRTVLSLNPFDLWALVAHNSHGFGEFTKPKTGECWDEQKIVTTLRDNGFFTRVQEFFAAHPEHGK